MKRKKTTLCISLVLIMLTFCSCLMQGISGEYQGLSSSWDYVLKSDSRSSGTFEIYQNGEKVGKDHIRYTNTWTKDNDVLTLVRDEDTTYYFKIYDDCLIQIENTASTPTYWDHIAPSGNTFNYEIGPYEFYESGTVQYYYSYGLSGAITKGSYYKENDIIYCNLNVADDEFYPLFYIYDTDHITKASDVYIKQ